MRHAVELGEACWRDCCWGTWWSEAIEGISLWNKVILVVDCQHYYKIRVIVLCETNKKITLVKAWETKYLRFAFYSDDAFLDNNWECDFRGFVGFAYKFVPLLKWFFLGLNECKTMRDFTKVLADFENFEDKFFSTL
jgi:hypothetical protein